jgi:hypothetical protein
MDGERTVKKLLEGKAGGGRTKGRPRLRRMDGWCPIGLEEYGCKKKNYLRTPCFTLIHYVKIR